MYTVSVNELDNEYSLVIMILNGYEISFRIETKNVGFHNPIFMFYLEMYEKFLAADIKADRARQNKKKKFKLIDGGKNEIQTNS